MQYKERNWRQRSGQRVKNKRNRLQKWGCIQTHREACFKVGDGAWNCILTLLKAKAKQWKWSLTSSTAPRKEQEPTLPCTEPVREGLPRLGKVDGGLCVTITGNTRGLPSDGRTPQLDCGGGDTNLLRIKLHKTMHTSISACKAVKSEQILWTAPMSTPWSGSCTIL